MDLDEGGVVRGDLDGNIAVLIGDLESGVMVDSGEDPASGEGVEKRVGIATWDKDAFFGPAVFVVPFDGDTVG